MWLNLTLVAIGGAAGALCRHLVTTAAIAIPGGSTVWGTTVANLLGCALLGGLLEYSLVDGALSPRTSLAIRVGFLGSLTTFSTFVSETSLLATVGRGWAAGVYFAANVGLGWLLFAAAAALVRGWNP